MTLPVEVKHEGCVIAPTIGAVGIVNGALIVTLAEAEETHPNAFVTV